MTPEEITNQLRAFTGSEAFFPHWLARRGGSLRVVYTEGVKFVADNCNAYWLIDVIVSHQCQRKVADEDFQAWKFICANGSGHVVATDGDGNQIAGQVIHYTDFPLPEITLYFENKTICLPSER